MTSDMLVPYLIVMFLIIVGSMVYTNRPFRNKERNDEAPQERGAADRA